jgi:pimeloyl-ACP methyl ester carboxylesterase
MAAFGPASPPDPWLWGPHRIHWVKHEATDTSQGALGSVLLIHGFGACVSHWRHTMGDLNPGLDIFALDLLGFGASDKPRSRLNGEPVEPGSVRYCFDLWADQVQAFLSEVVPAGPVQIVGNSIGALVALVAADRLQNAGHPPLQVVLIDCAQRTLDERRLSSLPGWERASRPLVKRLVRQRWLLKPLFRFVARPSFVRQVLAQAYPSGANLDDELVEILLKPALDAGAVESFRGFVNLFEDHLAPDHLARLSVPVRMIWGARDPWEDPAEARRWAAQFSCIQELVVLGGLGHCPHDEAPERVNPILRQWLALME